MTEQQAPQRVIVQRTADEVVNLFGGVYASTYQAGPGTVVEVDADYGRGLLKGDGWQEATREDFEHYTRSLVPQSEVEPTPPPSPWDLKGQALTDALAALPQLDQSGTADEKRARIAEHLGYPKETDR